MKRLAGLVEPPGGAGQFYSFWVFLDCWVKSDRVEVCGESYGWESSEMEKWWGFECRRNLEKCPGDKHYLAARGWPPGANAVAMLLQVEVLCAEVVFCFRWRDNKEISKWCAPAAGVVPPDGRDGKRKNKALCAWRYATPARRSGSWQRVAARVPR
ncbi:hypothetical protein DEO72_LG6g646 [Vigna unguiculata]|uniref:Uncharacterized protein n=1 Tax=Vigna unguiculata TaxID=3917 RepID=A0A4D6M5Z0_VIGUN|nr:hypothetical protein DEO72_LG6g646 [Vigna unguiculata]